MARRGRPTKKATPGSKASLGLKVTASLKARIEEAAEISGRTQSQEAEYRLERSFDRQDLTMEVLSSRFGSEAANMLILLGVGMITTVVLSRIAIAAAQEKEDLAEAEVRRDWLDQRDIYDAVASTTAKIFEKYRPAAGEEAAPAKTSSGNVVDWKAVSSIAADSLEKVNGRNPEAWAPMLEAMRAYARRKKK